MTQLQHDTDETTGTNSPDYAAIDVPTDIPPSELHYTQRRAELHQIVMGAGHPSMLNQGELAERYDVDQSTISRDFDRLDEYYRANANGRRDLEGHSVYQRCIRGLLEGDEFREAARVQRWYDEFRDERLNSLEFRQRLDRLEAAAERGRSR